MNISPARENILKKIRKALTQSTPLPFPQSEGNSSVFQPSRQELEMQFAEQFSRLQGKFVFCLDYEELVAQLAQVLAHNKWDKVYCREDAMKQLLAKNGFTQFTHQDLASCDVSITGCDQLIARTGSIIMSAGQQSGRTTSVYAPVHICIAWTGQLVYEIREGMAQVKEKYGAQLPSMITLATGPSRTADIEKTLVVGVHGPKEVYVFLVDQPIAQ
jgi:L-lactate dehydrogenase complex protein LldG